MTDAGVELLATIPSLTSLDLSGCNITDVGLVALGNNGNLKDLILSECYTITDIGIQVKHLISDFFKAPTLMPRFLEKSLFSLIIRREKEGVESGRRSSMTPDFLKFILGYRH